jgi:hypothetical protein
MLDSPNNLEQLVRLSHSSRLREAERERLFRKAKASRPSLLDKALLGLGEQMISLGSQLKKRYPSAPNVSHCQIEHSIE